MDNDEQARQQALWRERYGDMVPEKIVDTKIGADGKRYYKVQWAATTMEPGKNFLEAELLIKKYWDPAEKKLKFPSQERRNEEDGEESGSSSKSENKEYEIIRSKNELLAKCDENTACSSSHTENVSEQTESLPINHQETDNSDGIEEIKDNENNEESKFMSISHTGNDNDHDSKLKRKRSVEKNEDLNDIKTSNGELLPKKMKDDNDE